MPRRTSWPCGRPASLQRSGAPRHQTPTKGSSHPAARCLRHLWSSSLRQLIRLRRSRPASLRTSAGLQRTPSKSRGSEPEEAGKMAGAGDMLADARLVATDIAPNHPCLRGDSCGGPFRRQVTSACNRKSSSKNRRKKQDQRSSSCKSKSSSSNSSSRGFDSGGASNSWRITSCPNEYKFC